MGMATADFMIETHNGYRVNLSDPDPDTIDIEDIAWALSHLARFNGHAKRFYSVAEHCVLGSFEISKENRLWFLLHDAAEAYVGDAVRPMKTREMRAFEDTVLRVIVEKFGLPWPAPPEVKEVDDRMLATEARDLMVSGGSWWEFQTRPYEFRRIETRFETKPFEWYSKYLATFHLLWEESLYGD